MKRLVLVLWICLSAVLFPSDGGTAPAPIKPAPDGQKKGTTDQNRLVGKWTFVKTTPKTPMPGVTSFTMEFRKDGKLKAAVVIQNKSIDLNGTWTVKGNQLTLSMTSDVSPNQSPQTMTIQSVTDKTLVISAKQDGEIIKTEFRK